MKKRSRRERWQPIYSAVVVALSSTTEPMPAAFRAQTIARLRQAVDAITMHPTPDLEDWRVCCDAVNAMETIVKKGWASDEAGLQQEALQGLAKAGERTTEGKALRLTGPAATALRHLIEDYETCMAGLSEKSMRIVFNETDEQTYKLRHGINRNPNDTHVVIAL